jgi:P2-related tail formation protein
MALVRVDQSPKITDIVAIPIPTPDADDCFVADPFKVDDVKIYFLSRNFNTPSKLEVDRRSTDEDLLASLVAAQELACAIPTQENLDAVQLLQEEVVANTKVTTTFVTEAIPVEIFGNEENPAWISTDTENSLLTKIEEDEDGNPVFGKFVLEWNPLGQTQGDFIVCWTWTPLPAGDKLCSSLRFTLFADPALTTIAPHRTNPVKYSTLLDRYTAEILKIKICDPDLTPSVIHGLNESIAEAFTFVEDIANQIFDLQNANVIPERLLPLLGNLFNLKLKSGDPTLWRRQIKTAIPLYKKKGTKGGLEEALDVAGMKLDRCAMLWQVISPYTFQEQLDVIEDDQETFTLSKVAILPVDDVNFNLMYRGVDDDEYTELSSDYVSLSTTDGITTVTWVGADLSVNPVFLSEGDTLVILYEVIEVPPAEQSKEDYIVSLPLLDQRDERIQEYPLKNWNVRAIEEDDPLFDVIIPVRQPYVDPIVFGWIRTEIPYSENIYNMEEYNGSTRESREHCKIDKEFLDPCTYCQSSKYNVDIQIENLSNDRIIEALDVVEEFVPFHAQLHTVNFSGVMSDLLSVGNEYIEGLITFSQEDIAISGNGANLIFNRVMMPDDLIERSLMTTSSLVVSSVAGTGYNDNVIFYSPNLNLESEGTDPTSNLLEVLSPSPNAGEYTLSEINEHYATVSGTIAEPLNQSDFTFRLSNELLSNSSTDVFQDNQFSFIDETIDYGELGVKSTFDVENDLDYSGGAWKVYIPAYSDTYVIQNILPDDILEITDPSGSLPSINTVGITYDLLDDVGNTIETSSAGELYVTNRGRVDYDGLIGPGGALEDVQNFMEAGDYLLLGGVQYLINGFVPGENLEFYISDYTDGDMGGVSTKVYKRLGDNLVGNFAYRGLTLETAIDYESSLGILNGVNAPTDPDDILEDNRFKENFLIQINPATEGIYYTMEEIDGTTITLGGLHVDWTTLLNGGTAVTFNIFKFVKIPISIPERSEPYWPGNDFDFIDRRGNVIIENIEETSMPMSLTASALNKAKDDEVLETIGQKEVISFTIETANGNNQEGEI